MKQTRWQQRFENFERAFILLDNTFKEKKLDQFSLLEKEGVIQRFEFTFELAWKTLKDYLEYSGIKLTQITPRETLKQAFAAGIIENGELWISMLEQRNLLSHTYDEREFAKAFQAIADYYLSAINQVFQLLKQKNAEIA
jgi:nucleotidyltransferase substrate binding protein (TIGR01987 family)